MTFLLGIPQIPELISSSSSNGMVTLDVATAESGTRPSSFFQFNVVTRNPSTQDMLTFSIENRQYVDGETMILILDGFTQSVNESVYLFTLDCSNSFGTSGSPDQFQVTVNFGSSSTGTQTGMGYISYNQFVYVTKNLISISISFLTGAIAGGVIGAVVAVFIIVLILLFLVLFCYYWKRS